MSYGPIGSASAPVEMKQTGINANAATESNSLDTGAARLITFQILANTGAHATHVTQLQCSSNDVDWQDVSGATIAGLGIKGEVTVSARYVRGKITTPEGEDSTIDLIIQSK